MPPLILAFVLGGLMEENLRRSFLISDGSWSFLWDRPLTMMIMITILLIVGWQIYISFFKKKKLMLIVTNFTTQKTLKINIFFFAIFTQYFKNFLNLKLF